ncbi:MAG: tRNA uridine(34) 5-carboxymethylaminomethyl modification radical SAM/GNAT enzyme Elp3 [Candidatus Magasanikbacteria bacterium]|nr:tRNA uridine(34) 5-carboxymethylaminomethyl modification radical SAM/GNAT enzyme Elp3 [Candidatus Magasanikbacteria bacterium]
MKLSLEQQLIISAIDTHVSSKKQLDALKRSWAKKHKQSMPDGNTLIKAYRYLREKKLVDRNTALELILQIRGVRTLSGVAILTVLTKPFVCPGKCTYCPNDPEMPKSYIKDEPAAQRAYFNKFDPYQQVYTRLESLTGNGHTVDKAELIVKGGSWSVYACDYKYWFISECFRACNDFRQGRSSTVKEARLTNTETDDKRLQTTLHREQKKNETARCRIIGLTLETRPDLISAAQVAEMRDLGTTRLEIGVQHTDENIQRATKRGHGNAEVYKASRLLRIAGFKLDYHLMPQLPLSTPQKDLKMIKEIFSNPEFCPDMIKIYPCTVIDKTELYEEVKKGKFMPYPDKKLIDILIRAKSEIVPTYCRISRLIRDIPSHHIMAGNTITNLREVIQKQMKERVLRCKCLRCREVGHQMNIPYNPQLFITEYPASGGQEYFLSFEDPAQRVVYAFLRLRIENQKENTVLRAQIERYQRTFPAYIRELHTYGHLISLHKKTRGAKIAQHKGLGKQLVKDAEKICRKHNVKKLAVISGIGVRDYYRSLGFRLVETYMVKNLA